MHPEVSFLVIFLVKKMACFTIIRASILSVVFGNDMIWFDNLEIQKCFIGDIYISFASYQ